MIATPRTLERIRVLDLPEPDISFDDMLQQELDCARFCQQIIAVTSHDADLVRRAGYENVSVLGHELQLQPTPAPFETRHSILFFGAIHDEGTPNHDSLVWFVDSVLPILDRVLPPDVHFTIAGYVGPDVDMTVFRRTAGWKSWGLWGSAGTVRPAPGIRRADAVCGRDTVQGP